MSSDGSRRMSKSRFSAITRTDTGDATVFAQAAADSVTSMGEVLRTSTFGGVTGQSLTVDSQSLGQGHLRAEGGERLPMASVPLLPDVQLELDDKDAAVVLVFPQKVASERDVERPGETLSKAFRGRTKYLCLAAQEVFDGSRSSCGEQPMGAWRYQRVVREELASVLADAGFRTKMRESIDGKEMFALVSLPRHGAAIRRMAQTYSYKLPLKRSAYEYVDETMMANDHGEAPEYVAYTETAGLDVFLQSFTLRDEILIAKRRLEELIHFNELYSQGVLCKHFAAARYEVVVHLHRSWSKLSKMCLTPNWDTGSPEQPGTLFDCLSGASHHRVINDVKDCYGEEVAFFYMWLGCFVLWLLPLAVISLVVETIRRHHALVALSKSWDLKICLSFALVLLLWASLFNKFWQRKEARMRQAWGITGEAMVQTSAMAKSYKPWLNGTWRGTLMKYLSYACLVMYVLGFVYIVVVFEPYASAPHSAMQKSACWRNLLPVCGIYIFKRIWTRIVPYVVDLQNHETQAKWNDCLTWCLVPVNLLITVYPFLYILFFKKFVDVQTMSPDSQQYKDLINAMLETILASGGGCYHVANNATNLVRFLTQQDFMRLQGGMATFSGCLPVKCWVRHPHRHIDTTNCMPMTQCDLELRLQTDCLCELESLLLWFYLLHFTGMLVVLICPILLARFAMKSKIIKGNLKAKETAARPYSFTQFQAACFGLAQYHYGSWGGSWVDNFMRPAIVFLHLQCFSLVAPFLPAVAFPTLLLEYRLMAYRHNNLTCRNWPYASVGIGAWSQIFKYCSWSGVFCIVCKMTLLDDEEKVFDYYLESIQEGMGVFSASDHIDYKFGNFILLLSLTLLVNSAVGLVISDDPSDVEDIRNFNAQVKAKLLRKLEHGLSIAQSAPEPSLDDVVEMKRMLVAGLDSPSATDSASDSDCGMSSADDTQGSEHNHLFGLFRCLDVVS